ncbi:MAG: cytochrome C [Alphaproteobacteria bacterium CG_4_10_14_0_2_um_filter_63_37]|nr:MAG: cytochrome C [Proteobacteria bacterium CG1_02_64_396]PJA24936.1 MAG: cytochrome C [Alphaproteobacteria bacterium CG_4_10_14_0_2_um_filter_63_37]
MRRVAPVLAASALLLASCGGQESYTPAAGAAPAQIFEQACAACHGDKGQGKFGLLLKIAGHQEQAEVVEKIGKGGVIMPAFPNIASDDRKAVAAWLAQQ